MEHEPHGPDARAEDAGARVVALLDASRQSLAALSAAVELAVSRRAELLALYVEDIDLLTCAAFPFSCEVGARSGLSRPLSVAGLEANIARRLVHIHRALDRAVAGRDLRHRLEVSRGRVVAEALAKAAPGDVLVLGKTGDTEALGARLGSTSRRLLLEAPCTVLIWEERRPYRRGPLYCLHGGPNGLGGGLNDGPRGEPPGWLAALFEGLAPLPVRHAQGLVEWLAHGTSGGLLLGRDELARLLAEDPELLGRLPLPVVVT